MYNCKKHSVITSINFNKYKMNMECMKKKSNANFIPSLMSGKKLVVKGVGDFRNWNNNSLPCNAGNVRSVWKQN